MADLLAIKKMNLVGIKGNTSYNYYDRNKCKKL